MRQEFSHWYWYEKISSNLLKNYPVIELIDQDRKKKVSELLKQVAYEIAGGLRGRAMNSEMVHESQETQINLDAVKRLKELSL